MYFPARPTIRGRVFSLSHGFVDGVVHDRSVARSALADQGVKALLEPVDYLVFVLGKKPLGVFYLRVVVRHHLNEFWPGQLPPKDYFRAPNGFSRRLGADDLELPVARPGALAPGEIILFHRLGKSLTLHLHHLPDYRLNIKTGGRAPRRR